MAQSNRYDLEMNQGCTFSLYVKVQDPNGHPIDLTDYQAILQIRTDYANSSLTEQLSIANGEITAYISNSTLFVSLSPARTGAIYVDLDDEHTPPRTKYVYDLKLTDQYTTVSKLMYGSVTVTGEVTH